MALRDVQEAGRWRAGARQASERQASPASLFVCSAAMQPEINKPQKQNDADHSGEVFEHESGKEGEDHGGARVGT